jgi:hypothetical protein
MTFEGFPPPTKNFFGMPNEMINVIAHIDNLAELKVLIYIVRHTWGYQEYGITKAITVEEFMHGRKRQDGTRMDEGTGLKSDRSVKDGLKAAIDHGFLLYDRDDTDLARIKKSYALKMHSEHGQVDTTPHIDENRQVVSTPQTGSIYPPEGQNLPPNQVVSTPRSEKDTLEKHLEKDTLERQEGADAPTRAELIDDLKEIHPVVKHELERITGEHPAVRPNEMPYHIATGAIGNERVDTPGRLRLPSRDKIGASTHGHDTDAAATGRSGATTDRYVRSSAPDTAGHQGRIADAQQQEITQQTPGVSLLDDQASRPLLVGPEPAQAVSLPPTAGSMEPAPTAQASGHIPRRPRGKHLPVSLTLMGSQVMQWIGEIRGAKPRMTAGNIRACNALAECDGMSKEALAAYFASIEAQNREVDLLTAAGETGNDKVGFLSFESNWPKLKRKVKGSQQQAPPQGYADDDYSLTAQLWRQEHRERSAK